VHQEKVDSTHCELKVLLKPIQLTPVVLPAEDTPSNPTGDIPQYYSTQSMRYQEISTKLLRFFVRYNVSQHALASEEFGDFVSSLNPQFPIPGASWFISQLEGLYQQRLQEVLYLP